MTPAIESSRLCPPDDALALFVDGGLSDAARAEIERHVETCSVCRRIAHDGRSASLDTSADRLRDLLVESQPTRLGRYEVVDRIGAGAMGTVYEARDPDLERTVAIKCVAIRDAATLARHRERLREEAQALALIADPRVVRIYDVGDQDGLLFLVMERVEGLTLRAWVKHRSAAEILAAYAEAGRVLGALHRRGLVHGDFKPDNVIVEPGGRVRVLDFGLARLLLEETQTGSDRAGRGRGTPVYMAPELLEGESSAPATDQWAWAVSLFEALCGRRPFSGQDLHDLRRSVATARLRWPDAVAPRRVRRTVARALNAMPSRRWASMDACVRAMRPAKRRGLVVALGVACVAAIVIPRPAPAPSGTTPVRWALPWSGPAGAQQRPSAPLGLEDPVYELRERLTAVEWLSNADATATARRKIDAVLVEAEQLGVPSVVAEALTLRGRLLRRAGELEEATAHLERAYSVAIGIGYDAIAAHSASQLVALTGVAKNDPELAARWARHAQAAIERGNIDSMAAALANSRGLVALENNALEEARTHFERSRALMHKHGVEPARLSSTEYNLGIVLYRLGDPYRAEAAMRAAIRVPRETGAAMGGDRGTTMIGLALAVEAQGDLTLAEQTLRAAIEALDADVPRPIVLAHACYNLGALLSDQQRYAASLGPSERAAELYRQTLGPDHASTALAQTLVGGALTQLGHHERAAEVLASARVAIQAAAGPGSAQHIQVMRMLARNEVAKGQPDRAAQTLRSALADAEVAGSPDFEMGVLLNSLGNLERERGNLEQAELLLRRAIELEGTSNPYRSTRRQNLALTLRDAGRFDEALEMIDEALVVAAGLTERRPRTAALMSVRGTIGLRGGRPELAAASFEQALAMLEPTDHRKRIEWLRLLAQAESELGRSEASAQTMRSCRELADRTEDGPATLQAAEDWLSS